MHNRLVCGESIAPPDSLQRGTRVPLRRKLGLFPIMGGSSSFRRRVESKGVERRAGNIAMPSGGEMRARARGARGALAARNEEK